MKPWDLERKADYETFRELYRDGMIDEQAFRMAKSMIRPPNAWLAWVSQMLLFYGSALVLAGIVFFFAYNWAKMGRFVKFGIIEAGIVACAVSAHIRGLSQLSGKILILSASVLTGVLLAVFGQIYQTGADAYELFTGWAMLIACWVAISDFAALWMVWLVILNATVILFWSQVGKPAHMMSFDVYCLTLSCINGGALLLREIFARRGVEWLSGLWHRWVLLLIFLTSLSVPVILLIVDSGDPDKVSRGFPFLWCLSAAVAGNFYRFKSKDMASLSLIVANLCVLILTWMGNSLFSHMSYMWKSHDGGPFLLFALCIICVVSCAAYVLKMTSKAMAEEVKGEIEYE